MNIDSLVAPEWIDEHASDIAALDHRQPPIDLRRIAASEPIAMRGDDYCGAFDGRLEYHRGAHQFLLFYDNRAGEGDGRVRFSVAHELGHYFLDDHRGHLRGGGMPHSSRVDFQSKSEVERQADHFAACLLLPRFLVDERINMRLAELDRILELAREFETSLTSAALRYVTLSHFPCALVKVTAGVLDFAIASDSMKTIGLGFARRGTLVPPESPACRLSMNHARVLACERDEGTIDAGRWFNTERDIELLEQAVGLGRYGSVLALLSAEESEVEDDDEL